MLVKNPHTHLKNTIKAIAPDEIASCKLWIEAQAPSAAQTTMLRILAQLDAYKHATELTQTNFFLEISPAPMQPRLFADEPTGTVQLSMF